MFIGNSKWRSPEQWLRPHLRVFFSCPTESQSDPNLTRVNTAGTPLQALVSMIGVLHQSERALGKAACIWQVKVRSGL